MLLMVDDEGRKALNQLVDIALKQGGLNNLQGVIEILKAAQDIKPEPVETKEEKKE